MNECDEYHVFFNCPRYDDIKKVICLMDSSTTVNHDHLQALLQ